jgi:hypothetical protein
MSFDCSVLQLRVPAEPFAAVVPFCAFENKAYMREKSLFPKE